MISASFYTNAQSDFDTNSKEIKKYHRNELRLAKKAFTKAIDYESINTKKVQIDTLNSTYKTDIILTQCSKDFFSDELFGKGKLTGEMFYEKMKINPNSDSRILINQKDGDTIKTKLWNNGKGSLSILNFVHMPELDKKTERRYVIWTTTEKLFRGGHSVLFLSIKNKTANKETSLTNFIENATEIKLIYSHNEI
jgi:hypothetical protein